MQVSLFLVQGLYAHLAEAGLGEAFLREACLTREIVQNGRARLELEAMLRAGRAAYLLADEPALALRAGAAAPFRTLGVLGALLLQCASLREALAELDRYLPLLATRGGFCLREQGAWARLSLEIPIADGEARRFVTEYLLALLVRLAREFLGHATVLHELRLPYAEPRHVREYQRVFDCPIRFESNAVELVFASALLDRRQLVGDERVRGLLRDEADALYELEIVGAPVHQRVYSLLRSDPALWDAGPAVMAKLVGLSARTLRRRLTREGKSLSALIEEARLERARYLLTETDVAIKSIAERLGYSEPSAFHRAFKRWTGQTPARFKRDQQALSIAC